jgi:hypothetical protein
VVVADGGTDVVTRVGSVVEDNTGTDVVTRVGSVVEDNTGTDVVTRVGSVVEDNTGTDTSDPPPNEPTRKIATTPDRSTSPTT